MYKPCPMIFPQHLISYRNNNMHILCEQIQLV
nr:MAG TPA: hypothetical protein [Caudoviricetes sp.]